MEPYSDNTVTFRVLLAGYRGAAQRFHGARLARDATATFHPLFEALNWAVALDDQVRARWSPTGELLDWRWRDKVDEGRYVRAVRFARNRIHHQWADALELTHGAVLPTTLPSAFHEWRWRDSMLLPVGASGRDQDVYDELFANQPARYALDALDRTYSRVADLLEPIGPEPPDARWTT